MRRRTTAALVAAGVVLAGWIGWGLYTTRSLKSIPYEVVDTVDGVELRHYPSLVTVETTAPDQITAFRRLYRYLTGENEGEQSIAMTSPVATDGGTTVSMTAPVQSETTEDDTVEMAFYLPTEYDIETAPIPTDPAVELATQPARTVAAKRFSWYAPRWRVTRQERTLRKTIGSAGINTEGSASLLRYDDPWTPPFMRRNEVIVEIDA